jgi:hypothetical protein
VNSRTLAYKIPEINAYDFLSAEANAGTHIFYSKCLKEELGLYENTSLCRLSGKEINLGNYFMLGSKDTKC